MKKTFLIFGMCAAMIACTESPKEEGAPNTEQHSHEGGDHSHATPADEGGLSMEERTVVYPEARVFFANLEDGASVKSPIHIEMGVEGMTIQPAGEIVEGTGHHHILVNNELGFLERGEVVPVNDTSIHFGKGQTEYDLVLEPGQYLITLQFGNGFHESFGEQLSKTISVTVEPNS